ncbi:uncharacterized protein LOC124634419 [Helicoverpa zea]|uniref:uncharacterized protein LOC124634419 n=1 Tax=Helicoverpa zea TaxID=7113 RepID=UPI000B3656DE|nr:uncharacterized protein LOC124634419 [Helicoverpa zea]PZC79205.1 hypothetical protein B5X24_HaOG216769 [Helicoverpa armigera]
MLRYLVPLLFILSSVTSRREWMSQYRPKYTKGQIASESQLKFALENKYDDTGPGAKQPEYAYHTYKTLEDALIAYLDDPDTKLPEHERMKAINKLTKAQNYATPASVGKLFHKNSHFNDFTKPQFRPVSHETDPYNLHANKIYFPEESILNTKLPKGAADGNILNYQAEKVEPFGFHKLHTVKGSPLSLAHYTRDNNKPEKKQEIFDAHPKYTFSYGVHDKTTGDSKTVQESRDGGSVRGYYSFLDSDGKTRSVYYTADDRLGFRANVQKTD